MNSGVAEHDPEVDFLSALKERAFYEHSGTPGLTVRSSWSD